MTIPVLDYVGEEAYLASLFENAAPGCWMSGFGAPGVSDSDGNAAEKSHSGGTHTGKVASLAQETAHAQP